MGNHIKMTKPCFNNCWIALILIFSSCIPSRQARLNRVWPVHYRFFSVSVEALAGVQAGYIVRKKGDTLRGYMRLVTSYDDKQTIKEVPLLPFDKNEKKDIIRVGLDDIDFVRIYSPRKTIAEDYMPVRSAMWLVLGRKGRVNVCYQRWGLYHTGYHTDYYETAVLVSGQQVTNIPINPSNSTIYHPRYLYYVQFINKRYGKNFTTKDFNKDKTAMIKYILDQENLKAPGRSSS